jgi:hypothetical protein
MTELNTTIHGIDIKKLPSEVKNNPAKLGAILISEKCHQLGEQNKKLKAERELLLDRAAIAITYSNLVHNQVVANQSAVIDSILSDSSEQGMTWIRNGLFGPGHLNEVQEQVEKNTPAQEYFDKHEIPIKSHDMYKADIEEWLSEKVGK